MTTPVDERKVADLSRMAQLDTALRKAREDRKQLEAYIDDLEARIQAEMGDAEVAKVEGVERYTWARSDSYAVGRFRAAHPEIAQAYTIMVEKPVLDVERLLREQKALIAPFQTRVFLVK